MRLIRFCIQYPQALFYMIAGLCLYVALVNYHSSIAVADYIETEGEICNLESEQVLWHQQYVASYDYDIVWYDDGEKYTKHLDEQVNSRDEGPCTIWVRPDNKDALLGNSTDMREDVPIYILVALASGVIAYFICKMRQKKESRA
ncbi:MAG: hypothetical protein PUA77_05075, partial [Lachnospiraceae bacterium]|nr:hypothetical protein [Lachnospiraceae bacterium]